MVISTDNRTAKWQTQHKGISPDNYSSSILYAVKCGQDIMVAERVFVWGVDKFCIIFRIRFGCVYIHGSTHSSRQSILLYMYMKHNFVAMRLQNLSLSLMDCVSPSRCAQVVCVPL